MGKKTLTVSPPLKNNIDSTILQLSIRLRQINNSQSLFEQLGRGEQFIAWTENQKDICRKLLKYWRTVARRM